MIIELKDISLIDNQLVDTFLEKGIKSNDLIENTQQVSFPFAELKAKEWYFEGIRIGYAEWQYTEPMLVKWEFEMKQPIVTLYFNLRGRTKTSRGNRETKKAFELGNYQHNLFYSHGAINKGELRDEALFLTTFMIQFTLPTFLKLTQDANEVLKRFSENVIKRKSISLSDTNLYLDSGMHNAIMSIITCPYEEELKKMFLFAKCIELLVLQAEAYNRSLRLASSYVKNKYDKEQLFYAREYLSQHVECPPSLPELAWIIGLNEYKLKRGFKEMFGNTVFGYLSDLRLEQANRELLEKKKTASEIAYSLGYSSLQHFSAAFKHKFGVSPRKFLVLTKSSPSSVCVKGD